MLPKTENGFCSLLSLECEYICCDVHNSNLLNLLNLLIWISNSGNVPIYTSLRGVHSALVHSWSNDITSQSKDFEKSLYLQWWSSNLYSRYTPHLEELKGNSFTGDTDIIIPWSHETNKSLHIELWRDYDHQILKTGIPREESIKNPSAGGNDVIISWSRGFDKFIHSVMEGLQSLNLSNTFLRRVNGVLLHR